MFKVLVLALAVLAPSAAYAQSNIPIDSPRGNYEGADNIHWYQQTALRLADNEGLPPLSGAAFLCNEVDTSFNCFGALQQTPQDAFYAVGRVPVTVTILVDTRVTDGFSFAFRRAIDAVRRTNDAFSRSGILARLYITNVTPFDFDGEGYGYDPQDLIDKIEADGLLDVYEQIAADTGADIMMMVRNAEGMAIERCGLATSGVVRPEEFVTPFVISACEDDAIRADASNAVTAPHEFGHVFGLGHEADSGLTAHLGNGYAYAHPEFAVETIMGTRGIASGQPFETAPFFSSPDLRYLSTEAGQEIIMGNVNTADAVTAINQSAVNVALGWDRRHGSLAPSASIDGADNGPAAKARNTPARVLKLPPVVY